MFTVKSKRFLEELRTRQKQFGADIAARISVPEEDVWWGYHEFGTAAQGEKPTGEYPILPHGDYLLRWPDPDRPGEYVTVPRVLHHPGVRPKRLVRDVLLHIRQMTKEDVRDSFVQGGFRRDVVHFSFLRRVMRKALDFIVENIERQLPGSRLDGKLAGQTAAEVFARDAIIREVS